jgi:hypothetical protein
MEWFYFIVISIAIVLFILLLAYIGIRMAYNKQTGAVSSIFPPARNNCPDLWQSKEYGNNVVCIIPPPNQSNVGDLYTNGKTDQINYNIGTIIGTGVDKGISFPNTPGTSGDCAKKDWANMHGILWDGISNYNQC